MSTKPAQDILLVIGSARSGTTLVAKLLDSSNSTLYRHEPDSEFHCRALPFLPSMDQYEALMPIADAYIEDLWRYTSEKTSGTRPIFRKSYRSNFAQLALILSIFGAKAVRQFGPRLAVPDLIGKNHDVVRIMKSVSSMCRAPLFLASHGKLKILHVVRHPCAVISSLKNGIAASHLEFQDFLSDVSKMPEARSYPDFSDVMADWTFEEKQAYIWMVQNDKVFKELRRNGNYMTVVYEEVCTNVIPSMEKICHFCGIEFDDQMRSFSATLANYKDSDRKYFSVKKNLNSSLNKWRMEMNAATQKRVYDIVKFSNLWNEIYAE